MININSLKIIRCTKLRPAHVLDTRAAHRRDKEAFRMRTESLRREAMDKKIREQIGFITREHSYE